VSQLYEEVIECPKCRSQLRHMTWASTNTFNARYYTDTYVDSPAELDNAFTCPTCKSTLWADEIDWKKSRAAKEPPLEKIRWIDSGSFLATLASILLEILSLPIRAFLPKKEPDPPIQWDGGLPHVGHITFQQIIDNKLWRNRKDERYTRVKRYIEGNHPFRNRSEKKDYTPEDISNMTALMGLLGNLPNDQVLKAEILRNLGRFRESIQQLEGKSFSGKLEPYAAMILDLATKEIRAPQIAQQVH
jgi:hypothetical protein